MSSQNPSGWRRANQRTPSSQQQEMNADTEPDTELDVMDFPCHKNLSKVNKQGLGKFCDISRGKYKCPGGIDNCCEGCGGNRYRLRSKESRKGSKTKKLSKRRLPVTEDTTDDESVW